MKHRHHRRHSAHSKARMRAAAKRRPRDSKGRFLPTGRKHRHHAKKRSSRRDPMSYRRSRLGRRHGAAGAWYLMRDPAWYGDHAHHSRAAKKGWRRRDPAWYGEPRRHAKAAKKGWRRR